jgi:hypothetical protein
MVNETGVGRGSRMAGYRSSLAIRAWDRPCLRENYLAIREPLPGGYETSCQKFEV